jgi:hypothetical protein
VLFQTADGHGAYALRPFHRGLKFFGSEILPNHFIPLFSRIFTSFPYSIFAPVPYVNPQQDPLQKNYDFLLKIPKEYGKVLIGNGGLPPATKP